MVAAASVATPGLDCPPTRRTQPSGNDVAARPSTAAGSDGPGVKAPVAGSNTSVVAVFRRGPTHPPAMSTRPSPSLASA
jgi:hypothetical protein